MRATTSNTYRPYVILLVLFLFSTLTVYAQQFDESNPPPAYPPDDVNRTMDRDQMLWQLGIRFLELPPKLEDPHAPYDAYPRDPDNPEGDWTDSKPWGNNTITRSAWGLWNNYDDRSDGFYPGPDSAKVGNYTPINLLEMNDGSIITTAEEWWNDRRPEIKKDVEEQMWGVIPPEANSLDISWEVNTTYGERNGIAYKQKAITGNINVSSYPQVRNIPKITATLRVPANTKGYVPVMIVYNWGGLFGSSLDRYWDYVQPEGWGVVEFNINDLQPDFVFDFSTFSIRTGGDYLTSYLIGLVNKGEWRKPTDWGTLAAWSWGVSRLIDYLETDPDVDNTQIGITGHSRFGKAALVTVAYEPRIAIAFPSESGSLGAKMNRRHWGQNLENSGWDQEYHWMAGNFFKWMGPLYPGEYMPRKVENLPVDAHSLLSLAAPRPVFINGGNNDTWVDPYGEYLTTVGATPVYELLGKKGIVMNDPKPQLEKGYIEGDLAYRYHDGGHTDAPDWPDFLRFANKYIEVAGQTTVTLWPPDHKYESIALSDFGSSIPYYGSTVIADGLIVKVTSDEAEDAKGAGDGKSMDDIAIADDFKSVDLRRERDGNGNGRVYTMFIALTDAAENVDTVEVKVQVPHDQKSVAEDDGEVYAVLGADLSQSQTVAKKIVELNTLSTKAIPTTFALEQNYPNPFNPSTIIRFSIPEAGNYTLRVYNMVGQEVAEIINQHLTPGTYTRIFEAPNLASGTYIYNLKGNKISISKKMTILR